MVVNPKTKPKTAAIKLPAVPKYVALAVVEKRTASKAPAPMAMALRAKRSEKWNWESPNSFCKIKGVEEI